jgi:AcrR family transcriptional regulator
MATSKRTKATTSRRDELLEGAERLMVERGYASVTYRNVAAMVGVTGGLVQYYFPTLDDLLVAMIDRRAQQNVERLLAALASRPDQPLRVVWELSADEQSAALTIEFMALANHRKSLQSRILAVIKQLRATQMAALQARWDDYGLSDSGVSPGALLFLLHNIPKMLLLEESVGLTAAHQEVLDLVARHLDEVEPERR